MQRGIVWVVDDDSSIRWVLERALAGAGLTCTTFENGAEVLEALASKTFGEDRAEFGIKPLMGSEDFSFMLEAQPKGGFLLFGNGDVGEGSCMVHNPGYDFNDASLVPASSYWGALVEAWLQ